MNFILPPPSLEHRALVKIAVMLWSQRDIIDGMLKSSLFRKNVWQEVDELVAEKVSKLPLPALINEKLLEITEQVRLQILSWLRFHDHIICTTNKFVIHLPDILVWTPHGTIDNKRTAEVLVKGDTITVGMRFILASNYCLEDDILDLCQKFKLSTNIINYNELTKFWFNYADEHDLNLTPTYRNHINYKYLIEYAVISMDNDVAIQYFFLKLRHQKNTETVLEATAKDIIKKLATRGIVSQCSSNIIYFLLSTMDAEQQAEILQSYTYVVLESSLYWPRQTQFLEIVKDKWNFLSKEYYRCLLHTIVSRMSCKRIYFKTLFLEFWQQSPETYKQFITDGERIGYLLLNLYEKKDERNIHNILNDSNISSRKNLIFSAGGQEFFKFLVYCEKWDSVEYFIRECILSPKEMTAFKDQFRENARMLHSGNKFPTKHQWNTFFQMVQDFIIIYKKRKVMEDNNTSSKKVCCKNIQE